MAVRVSNKLRTLAARRGGVQALVRLKPGLTRAEQRVCKRSIGGQRGDHKLYSELDLITARLTPARLRDLAERSEVKTITLAPTKDLSSVIAPTPRDESVGVDEPTVRAERSHRTAKRAGAASPAWGIKDLTVDQVWAEGVRGDGIVVAHLDTGVDEGHRAFQGRIAHRAILSKQGVLHTPEVLHDSHSDGHGTHTAGCICGRPVQGLRIGVAPDARLASAMVIEHGDVFKRVLRALQWVLDLRENDVNVRVLNLSLGFRGWEPVFQPLLRKFEAAGILTVACVGNDGAGTSRSPGNYSETIAVGAYNAWDKVWDYSSSDTWDSGRFVPDLVAPGVSIRSAAAGTTAGLRTNQGTSMATAYISGLAALLFSKHESATVAQVRDAILDACYLIDGVDEDRQGLGWPKAIEAMHGLDKAMA